MDLHPLYRHWLAFGMILIIAELFNPLMADRTEENELPAVCLLGRNTGMH